MKSLQNSLKNWIDTDRSDFIRTLLLSEGFGFCFFLNFIWGHSLDKWDTVAGRLIPSLLTALLTGSLMAIVLVCIWAWRRGTGTVSPAVVTSERAASEAPADSPVRERAVSLKLWLISAVLILIAWIPVWLAYFPAVIAYDAEAQLGQHISRMYTTHHPLLHTLIMGWCMDLMWNVGGIRAGMALYSVLQMIFMAGVLGWGIAEAHRLGAADWFMFAYGVFCALFPVHPILAISTTKDVIFSGLVLIFVLLLRRYLTGDYPEDKHGALKLNAKICVTAVFMILFRNNALYALVLMMIMVAVQKIPAKVKKPIILTVLAGCIVGSLAGAGLKAGLKAESGSPREALSIPMQQLARVYARHGDEIPPELAGRLEIMLNGDRETISDRYNEHLADPVKKEFSLDDPAGFVKTWVSVGVSFLGEYLDAWLCTTKGAWHIYDASVNRIYGEGRASGFGYLSTDMRTLPPGFEVDPSNYLPWLRDLYETIVSDNAFEEIPFVNILFAPATYIWILVAYAYVSRVRRNRTAITVLLYPLAIYLTILMGPAILVRYMYPFILLVILPMIPAARVLPTAENVVEPGPA